jgi:crossover junction endodeoxyribonuclease RuvC
MLILGIDPGLNRTGFGILEFNQGQLNRHGLSYINSGVISPCSDQPLPQRLKVLFESIQILLNQYAIDHIAIEQVFVNMNPKGSLLLGQARGALLASLVLSKADIFEYTALQIKKSVTGQGKARKESLQHMVQHILKLETPPKPDAADALACAITHANYLPLLTHLMNQKNSSQIPKKI